MKSETDYTKTFTDFKRLVYEEEFQEVRQATDLQEEFDQKTCIYIFQVELVAQSTQNKQ